MGIFEEKLDVITILDLEDTPDTYSDGLYLKSTSSGIEWATASGGGGTSNHSELLELDYASSGHTGFTSTAALTTTSGALQDQIDNLDYYTTGEVDTISGALQNNIDAKPDNFLELDDTPNSYDDGKHVKSTASGIEFDYTTFLELNDTPSTYDDGKHVKSTASGIEFASTTFLELSDTPNAYEDGKHVKSTASGIEFDYTTFLELTDTPTTYSGAFRLPLICNDNETGIVFGLIPETAISGTYFVSYEGGRLLRGATGNRPDLVYNGPIAGLAFSNGKTESCYGSFKIPYSWHNTTDIELKINFMNDDAQVGVKTVAWCLCFHAYQEGEFYSDKTLTTLHIDTDLPTDVAAGRFTVRTLDVPYDDADNPLSIGDTVTFQFYRQGTAGSDTMSGDAILISLSFEMKTGDLSQLAG